jgi:hypothetical protein
VYVEVVVKGTMGDLAASAFPELVVERRQILVAPEADAFTALVHLTRHNACVIVFRAHDLPPELKANPVSGDARATTQTDLVEAAQQEPLELDDL